MSCTPMKTFVSLEAMDAIQAHFPVPILDFTPGRIGFEGKNVSYVAKQASHLPSTSAADWFCEATDPAHYVVGACPPPTIQTFVPTPPPTPPRLPYVIILPAVNACCNIIVQVYNLSFYAREYEVCRYCRGFSSEITLALIPLVIRRWKITKWTVQSEQPRGILPSIFNPGVVCTRLCLIHCSWVLAAN